MVPSTNASVISLHLNLPPHPKKRPRVTKFGTFHERGYQKWMSAAVTELAQQWWGKKPLNKVKKLTIHFLGKTARADLDNCIGGVLDPMVKAGIIRDDNLMVINHIEATWERCESTPKKGLKQIPRIEILIEL